MAYSQIAVILDRSGSMSSVKQDTIGGFNEFVSKQKTNANPTKLLLTQFDDVYEILYNRDVKEVQNLDDTTYVPRGSTALHDAIGRTVSDLGRELSIKNPQDRPDRVLVLIITDGFENASKEYNAAKISEMIKHQQEKYSWEFMFLGTSKEAVLSAQSYGIKPGLTAVYFGQNVNSALRTMSAKASNYASANITDIYKATQDLAFTEQEKADLLDDKNPKKK
jgi:hypothetical protein